MAFVIDLTNIIKSMIFDITLSKIVQFILYWGGILLYFYYNADEIPNAYSKVITAIVKTKPSL